VIIKRFWPAVACLLLAMSPDIAAAGTQSSATARAVEQTVRAYFADIPVMIRIARCESNFQQYSASGKPLYNEGGTSAIGVMQIMYSVHGSTAKDLGYNLKTLKGNLAYARHLYRNEGTRPWNASRSCWG
jgi:hypothetical protein